MANKLTINKMNELLDWGYEKALTGVPTMDSAYALAEEYTTKYGVEEGIEKLVTVQVTKCGTSGFLAGLGGVLTLPVAIPANVGSVLFIQMRMISSIAIMRGYNLKDDQVQTFVYAALTGTAATEVLKQAGVQVGQKVAVNVIKKLPRAVIDKINKKIGFRLLTKFGQTGVINLGKMVPLVGGVIGGTYDITTTYMIADAAKKIFLPMEVVVMEGEFEEVVTFEGSAEQGS